MKFLRYCKDTLSHRPILGLLAALFLLIVAGGVNAGVRPHVLGDGQYECDTIGSSGGSTVNNNYYGMSTGDVQRLFDPSMVGSISQNPIDIAASNRNGSAVLDNLAVDQDGTALTSQGFEPSGIVWSPYHNRLIAVGDEGMLVTMRFDGTDKVATNVGRTASAPWTSNGGELDWEGVTVDSQTLSDGCVVGLAERVDVAGRAYVVRFNPSAPGDTNTLWVFHAAQIGGTNVNTGLEAIAFVPSNNVPACWGTANWTDANGLYLLGHQGSGRIYVMNIPMTAANRANNTLDWDHLSHPGLSAANVVTNFIPRLVWESNRVDLSDMYFDPRWGQLYLMYDEDGGEVTAATTLGRAVYQYDIWLNRAVRAWKLPSNPDYGDPEGVTLGPSERQIYVANDSGVVTSNSIRRYTFDAYADEGGPVMDVTMDRAPDAEDDGVMGYSLGSRWGLTTSGRTYINVGTNGDAAVWQDLKALVADSFTGYHAGDGGGLTNVSAILVTTSNVALGLNSAGTTNTVIGAFGGAAIGRDNLLVQTNATDESGNVAIGLANTVRSMKAGSGLSSGLEGNIAIGKQNFIQGNLLGCVALGYQNSIAPSVAVAGAVALGTGCVSSNQGAVALGSYAKALHHGAMVLSSSSEYASTASGQFSAKFPGGFRFDGGNISVGGTNAVESAPGVLHGLVTDAGLLGYAPTLVFDASLTTGYATSDNTADSNVYFDVVNTNIGGTYASGAWSASTNGTYFYAADVSVIGGAANPYAGTITAFQTSGGDVELGKQFVWSPDDTAQLGAHLSGYFVHAGESFRLSPTASVGGTLDASRLRIWRVR